MLIELLDVLKDKIERYDYEDENLPRRIFGTENELGFIPEKESIAIENYANTEQERYLKARLNDDFLPNGGLIYKDCSHPEYASPETANVLDAIRWQKAGELILSKSFPYLYKNSYDHFGNTFAAHVNFFTNAKRKKLRLLMPFLISNKIYNGSGSIASNGDFEISQRAKFIERTISEETLRNRAIINTRNEKLSEVEGWYRLHCIENDPHMCEAALGRDLGTMDLMLRLLEDEDVHEEEIFPRIRYDENKAVSDLHAISKKTENWKMEGIRERLPLDAITLQEIYMQTAWERYYGKNAIDNLVLEDWKETLDKLRRNPLELFGSVDWITKREVLKTKAESESLPRDSWGLKSYDLEYHRINREESIFYSDIENHGGTTRWVKDEEINLAVDNPPQNTRAFIRGSLIKLLKGYIGPYKISFGWKEYVICNGNHHENIALNDPRKDYSELFNKTKKILGLK